MPDTPPSPETPACYLHGLPGATDAEWRIAFGERPPLHALIGIERLPALTPAGGYRDGVLTAFDAAIKAAGGGPVRLVGFSLGAMAAVHIAATRAHQVSSLDLIAPAAPLQLGDFLADMAGRPVFEAARAGRGRLGLLTGLQSLGLRLAPGLVAGQLLSSAPEAERALMSRPGHRAAFVEGMKHAILDHAGAYRAELRAYVGDWSPLLAQVSAPTCIWQGTNDTWAPPAMAEALAAALGGPARIEWLEGCAHYGALVKALPGVPFRQPPHEAEA